MNRNVWLFLALIFVIGSLLIWRPFGDGDESQQETGFREVAPDFTASGLIMRIYDTDGKLAHRIAAEKMTHYEPIGLTELTSPVYIVHADGEAANWQIIAEQGSFYDDKTLVLERNIQINSLDHEDFMDRVETSYLVINTLTETMETEQPVTIYGKNFVMRGEGMVADLRTQVLEFKKHVESTYFGNNATATQ
ncbi:LPS export ABC transporter periplasmic protein LptC [Pseudidiomarina aestuarii]|uniref:Lipopolysaccharide export system protein LptC n=1 Tax=Pseudidiomarina aestuarii TaxID=624146 RepID=A0A7Z6ZV53_9GAMM|nr:LPS export ABC transporter periplasmic protein LptC [Pseudidiomarina aestuarii]RUO41806.1 LPS export ABC transporter periplasmic protein LptC [Pseudidiomarina aestuarii]